MPFISEKNKAAAAGGGGGYLNPSKITPGSSVRFALLDDQPLEFFECWGEDANGNSRPFRFSEDPSPEEITEEMGPDFSRRMNRDGNGPEKVKFSIAVPVYNYDSEKVEVLPLGAEDSDQRAGLHQPNGGLLRAVGLGLCDGQRRHWLGNQVQPPACTPQESLPGTD